MIDPSIKTEWRENVRDLLSEFQSAVTGYDYGHGSSPVDKAMKALSAALDIPLSWESAPINEILKLRAVKKAANEFCRIASPEHSTSAVREAYQNLADALVDAEDDSSPLDVEWGAMSVSLNGDLFRFDASSREKCLARAILMLARRLGLEGL